MPTYRRQPYTAHACTRGITSAKRRVSGAIRYKFIDSCRSNRDGLGEGHEVVDGVASVDVEPKAVFINVVLESSLEMGVESSAARESNVHAAKFAQKTLPRFDRDSMAALDFGQDLKEAEASVW